MRICINILFQQVDFIAQIRIGPQSLLQECKLPTYQSKIQIRKSDPTSTSGSMSLTVDKSSASLERQMNFRD